MALFINAFRLSPSPSAIGVKTYKVPGTVVYLPVRAEVAPLLIGFAAEFHRTVESLHKGWCWGYAYRKVRGRVSPSFHAGGLAIDLNAPRHPLGSNPANSFNTRQRALIRALCKKYGLRWGGDYTGRKDPMHVEVILPRAQALVLVKRLQAKPVAKKVAAPPPAYPGGAKGVRVGWKNSKSVKAIQVKVGVRADGDFGVATRTAVITWQRKHKLGADGVVGPRTWSAMFG